MNTETGIPEAAHPQLRTAVIGLGRIGVQFHIPEIVNHRAFVLLGVVDPLPERRTEVTAKWSVPAFETVGIMLKAVKPNVVIIASPTKFHAEQAREIFSNGAHVICDKPAACNVAEFDTMSRAAQASNRKLLIYQPYRLKPALRALKSILARGLIGRPYLIKRSSCSYERRRDWQAFVQNGGGLLNNSGSHFIDEMLCLFEGQTVASVFCQTRRIATLGDAEDVVKAMLVTSDGVLFDLEMSQACAQPHPLWQVFGATGAASWDEGLGCWTVRSFDPGQAPVTAAETDLAAKGRSYSYERLPWRETTVLGADYPELDFYDEASKVLNLGVDSTISAVSSRYLLQVIERCRVSAEKSVVT